MKKINNLLLLMLICIGANAQTTIVLRPDGSSGKDSEVSDYGSNANTNYGDVAVFASYVWTNGTVFREKALLQFDLSSIPADATITSASLDLYADNPTTTFVGSPSTPMNGSNNASYIRRITASWDEHTVTWNNQPSVTSTNQVTLPNSTSTTQDYIGTDVTQLVKDLITYGNNGWMIEQVTTSPSNSMIFRSSDYSDSTYRPRLTITYIQSGCLTLRPGSEGKDSEVSDYSSNVNSNYGDVAVFASYIWNNSSTTFREKALIQFDLSGVPANAFITSASLDLYADNPTSTFVGNPSTPMNGTNNASYIKRITASWDEHTVTWNNQPATTSVNAVTLPTSTSTSQNYIGTDVTQMVQDLLTYGNNGWMIEQITTSPKNSMIFRSSDYSDSTYRPQLYLCYTTDSSYNDSVGSRLTSIKNVVSEKFTASVYPNPYSNQFTIALNGMGQTNDVEITVTNTLGQTLYKKNLIIAEGYKEISINKNELGNQSDILFVTVASGNDKKTFKVLSQH